MYDHAIYEAYSVQEKGKNIAPKDRNTCAYIADIIVIECIIVIVGSLSILYCVWSPDQAVMDFDKLTRIMYLFDSHSCGYKLKKGKVMGELHISNETFGLNVIPIRWEPAIVTVSTRLSAKTRKYVELSLGIHVVWCLFALIFRIITKKSSDVRTLKTTLGIFFYSCVFVICFDLSMGVVYVTHIKQSLTKGMILRYSGWATEIVLESYDDFAGWLPIVASICWLRGLFIFGVNLYFCRKITIISRKIKSSEFRRKNPVEQYLPVPEPKQVETIDKDVLVYRSGEHHPQSIMHLIN